MVAQPESVATEDSNKSFFTSFPCFFVFILGLRDFQNTKSLKKHKSICSDNLVNRWMRGSNLSRSREV